MYTKMLRKIVREGLFSYFGHCSSGGSGIGHCY